MGITNFPGGVIIGGILFPAGAGSALTVTDGGTPVDNVGTIILTGATVTSPGTGVADVLITGASGVTNIATGAGLSGGPITSDGTLLADWNGGTVTALGSNLLLAAGTLNMGTLAATSLFGNGATAGAQGTNIAIGAGLTLTTGNTLASLGSPSLTVVGGATVTAVSKISFTGDATVTDAGGGEAAVAVGFVDPGITYTGGILPQINLIPGGGYYQNGVFTLTPGGVIVNLALSFDSNTTDVNMGNVVGSMAGLTIDTFATAFAMPVFATVLGGFSFSGANVGTLDIGALAYVQGAVALNLDAATVVNTGVLAYVGGNVDYNAASALAVNLSSLTAVGGIITILAANATTVDLGALTLSGELSGTMTSATGFNLDSLATLDGNLDPNLPAVPALNLPSLVTISGNLAPILSSATAIALNAGLLQVGGNVTLSGAAFAQASVDHVLIRLAALDGTGGTTSYDTKTVNLSGGTSATPGAAGLTAKATLEGRGNTVTVN